MPETETCKVSEQCPCVISLMWRYRPRRQSAYLLTRDTELCNYNTVKKPETDLNKRISNEKYENVKY